MIFRYDREVDAAYFMIKYAESLTTKALSDDLMIDIQGKQVVGIELLGFSSFDKTKLDAAEIKDFKQEILAKLEAHS